MSDSRNLRFMINSKCNARCLFCHNDGFQEEGEMSINDFYSYQDLLKNARKVRFSGGEPLLNKNVFEFIKTARNYCDDVGLVTNGWLLTEHIENIFDAKPNQVTVSIHSTDEYLMQKIAGTPSNILAELKQILQTLSKTGIKTKINSVIMKSTHSDIRSINNLLEYAKYTKSSIEFIEMDIDTVKEFSSTEYFSVEEFTPLLEQVLEKKVNFVESLCAWEFEFLDKFSRISLALCRHNLCNQCKIFRPTLIYPYGRISHCRIGKCK